MSDASTIPGYIMGTGAVPRSPISRAEFEQMKQSVLFGEDDVQALQMSAGVLAGQEEAILDVWYGFVGSVPHLLASFTDRSSGAPLGDYLGAVRRRFGQWIRDTAAAEYDQAWLDYQHEIGLRHHHLKKNQTDRATAPPIVPFRDLFLLIFPVTHTLRPFLGAGGHPAIDVERMHQAWVKTCLLQVTLWSHPYVREGDF